MDIEATIIMYMEVVGAIAFSVSGAVVGIKLQMDLFGVIILGCCTAVGGGMMRDIILCRIPAFLQNPMYFWIAAATAVLVFFAVYSSQEKLKKLGPKAQYIYDLSLLVTDAIGLGAFTVVGITVAIQCGHGDNEFILIFMGVLTAAGGGLLRDTMAGEKPYIFVKHIYALASIMGGVLFLFLYRHVHELWAVLLSSLFVVVSRVLAAHFRWSLPRFRKD